MNDSLDKKIRHRNAVARAHSQVSRGQATKMMVKEAPVYSGRAREIFPIVLVNLVLTFLTVGIYRFWAKTRIRRYFVSRVSFLGDPLEYTGTGKELFIGFLIVLVILVPFFVASNILQHFLTRPGTDPNSVGIFQAVYLTAFYFLYNVAVYRAQRYRLSRMNWRGIRGGQEGSALLYAAYAMIFGLLTLATLWLLYPVMRRVLIGYRINWACFGTERLSFTGSFAKLFAAWLVPWLLALAIPVMVIYAAMQLGLNMTNPEAMQAELKHMLPVVWSSYKYALIGGLVLVYIAYVWYRTFEARQWMNGARFDDLTFSSRLNVFHLFLPNAAYLAILAIIAGAILYGVFGIFAKMDHGLSTEAAFQVGAIFGIGTVVALWLLGGLLKPIIVLNWLLANVCKTLTIQGSFSPDTLFQNQLEIPRSGEGLADALDVDAF